LNTRNCRFYSPSSSPCRPSSAAMPLDTQKWTAPLVRKTFLDYFAERGHTIGMPSPHPQSSCVWLLLLNHGTALFWLHSIASSLTMALHSALVLGRPSQ
jgi:hypothetical protein